jgi:glycosyltransferase involved in cell wall biosynthesis
MKIAVYAIALNEAKHAKRWADATKDADIRIVADTGSTDGTQELLRAEGVIVHDISVKPFRFDDARNASLALVPDDIDMCLSLDLDEIPDEDLFKEIKKVWNPEINRMWITWETGFEWQNNNRLHSRYGYRWVKPCHEVTEYYGDFFGGEEKSAVVHSVVRHRPDDSKSRSQYLPMLQMAVAETPQDARMWAYLAREYFFHSKWKETIEAAEEMLKAGGWYIERAATCRAAAQAFVMLNNKEMARDWFVKGVKEAPDQLEAWYSLAQFNYEVKNWQGCWDSALKVETLQKEKHYLVNDDVWNWKCFDLLAIAGWYLGKKDEAIEYGKKAVQGNPSEKRLIDNLEWMQKNNANV